MLFPYTKKAIKTIKEKDKITSQTTYKIQTRIEHLNDEIITHLENKNIHQEKGIQSLDEKVLKEIKRPPKTRKIAEKTLPKLNSREISYETHLIYGLPLQTIDSFSKDLEFLLKNGSTMIRLFPLQLLEGTTLAKQTQTKYKNSFIFSPIFPQRSNRNKMDDERTNILHKNYSKKTGTKILRMHKRPQTMQKKQKTKHNHSRKQTAEKIK